MSPLTLTLPSDLRLLPVARAFVDAVCRSAGLSEEVGRAVVIAVDEAVNNVIRHSHRHDTAMTVQLECHLAQDHLEIRLLDEGEPFDLAAVPNLSPSELRIGGRGVYLMRMLMDEVTCEPRGPRGNTLRLVKRW
jgi:anti-sigma regulatory factor (Ser/Thr protein kinase)